ncbi:MAG: HAD-IA family hydrolase [Devosia sp.]
MRLVIFDLDGTLIDSEALIVATVGDAFRALNEPVPTDAAIRSISGITARDAMSILAPAAGPERIEEIVESYRTTYRSRAGTAAEPLFDGALAALDRLQAQPETILAVATGKGYRGAVTLLERHGLIERFNSIQTPDHNRGKPDPQMLDTAMTKAGIGREASVMIGDTVHDMRMAKAGGIKAIGVAWGYHEPAELTRAGADVVIGRFDELDAAIDQLLGDAHA